MDTAEYWIKKLDLKPHPEGGFYKETYRSIYEIEKKRLPKGYPDNRKLSTCIFYLLRSGEISKFHRLRSDEIWFYHKGSALKVIILDKEGKKHVHFLGSNSEKPEQFQLFIPAGVIFAAEVTEPESYSIFSCVVTPGFEFDDFELFDKNDLIQAYPKHYNLIEKYG